MENDIPNYSRRSFLATGAAAVAASGASVATKSALSAEPSRASVSVIADALGRVGRNPMSLAMTPDIKPLTSGGGTIFSSRMSF